MISGWNFTPFLMFRWYLFRSRTHQRVQALQISMILHCFPLRFWYYSLMDFRFVFAEVWTLFWHPFGIKLLDFCDRFLDDVWDFLSIFYRQSIVWHKKALFPTCKNTKDPWQVWHTLLPLAVLCWDFLRFLNIYIVFYSFSIYSLKFY